MKRFLSILLAAAIIAGSCCVFALAGDAKKASDGTAPLIVVSGFGTVPLTLNAGTDNAQKVWAPTANTIIKGTFSALTPLPLLILGKWDAYMDIANPKVLSVFEPVRCDENGDSIYDVTVQKYPLSAGNYPDFYNSDTCDEQAFVKTAIETFGEDNVYFFSYDWRLDPVEHAKELKTYVENVKTQTGSDEVTLAGCSMGGTVILSYLMLYGSSEIKNFIFDNAAFYGTALVGELFKIDLCFDNDATVNYIYQFTKSELLKSILEKTGIIGKIIPLLDKIIDKTSDRISKEVLYPVFAQMPGMWSLVDDASYEDAKAMSLDATVNAELIAKIDRYHYDVQKKAPELLQAATENGTNIFVLANYGFYGVPLTSSRYNNNDILIDTKYASGGAICANIGETLGEGYTQKIDCGHNHLSSDGVIDASTCIFPEYTWFVSGMKHLDYPYGTDGASFLMWLVGANEQYTVRSNKSYPQFMKFDEATGKLTA